MSTAPIYVINQARALADADAARMAAAVNRQVAEHLAPAWGRLPNSVQFARASAVPRGGYVVALLDTLDDPDAGGWHTDDGPTGVHGVVGVRTYLDHGGTLTSGPDSVSVALSHEVCELAVDVHANLWADTGRGWSIALEVCDPVEGESYPLDGIAVSDFVTPDFFDPTPAFHASLDFLGLMHRPFSLLQGGYFVYLAEGQPQQKFGTDVPGWKRELKAHPSTRVARLAAKAAT